MRAVKLAPFLAARAWLVVALGAGLCFVAGCPQPQSAICPSGRVCPSPYTCAATQDICILGNCGNGVIDNGEACDDGNVLNDDKCNKACTSDNTCGNGHLDNTFTDSTRNEVCDDGPLNGQPGRCSADCKSNGLCGNGQRDNGEDCDYCIADDPGDGSADGALDGASGAGAGSAITDAGDDGAEVGASTQQCSLGISESRVCNSDCTTARCGDRKINQASGEQCDDGGESKACNVDCTFASCGDGKTNRAAGEECDVLGGADTANCNGTAAASLNAACHFSFCGDGYVNAAAGETCDAPMGADSKTCNGAAAGPGVACHTAVCGDGYVDAAAGETCDVLGGADTANCNGKSAPAGAACHAALCGDGYVNHAAGESCEVGASGADTTSCNGFGAGPGLQCTVVVCGDGYVNGAAGETCEVQLNGLDTVNCNGAGAGAVRCRTASCGDGYINHTAGETCEVASNGADSATCNGINAPVGLRCVGVSCGDGYANHNAGEDCDVAGGGDSATCNGTPAGTALECKTAVCGDGYLNTKKTEACDDKNQTSGDGCSSPACQVETGFTCPIPGQPCRSTCGDGQKLGTEACDDFNTDACGTCNATCTAAQTAAPAIGTITAVSGSNTTNGESFTLSDGIHGPVVFEFDDAGPTDVSHIPIQRTGSSTQMAAKIASAINAVGAGLAINALVNNSNKSQVQLTNGNPGTQGNVNTALTVGSFKVTVMAGGFGFDCPATKGCGGADDCQSGVCCLGVSGSVDCPCPSGVTCTKNQCLAPTCKDNVVNGAETDQDCGGGTCSKCGLGLACLVATDCASGVCVGSTCLAPSCTDHVPNGTETDVDCGGGCPRVPGRSLVQRAQRLRSGQHLQVGQVRVDVRRRREERERDLD